MSLEQLRQEHHQVGIGPSLSALLERIVRSTAPTYPAQEYSDAGVWTNDALGDALQDWVEARLLRRGDLSAMLLTAASERALRAALTTSFSQFLINRRRRTSATNLFKRTLKVLSLSELFQLVTGKPPSSATVWTLSRQPSGVSSAVSQKSLLALAWELSDEELEVVRYGPYSLKSSPILREPALVRFLVHLLGRADGALSLAQIAEVMRLRFNLTQLGQVELDDQLASSEQPIIAQVEVSEVVSSVRSRLGQSAIEALREFSKADGDFKRAAVTLDTSPRQVQAEVSSAMWMIAEYAETLDEARAAYAKLIESLF